MVVIGSGGSLAPEIADMARDLGRVAVEAGFRIVTGGLGGVMAAASEGARSAERYTEGSVLGVLPSYDRTTANPWVDVVIPSGLQLGRNTLVVAMAGVVVAVGGGAGTLSEIALAWQLQRPVIGLVESGGWATELGGRTLDNRHDEPIATARSAAEAVALASSMLSGGRREAGDIGSGWRKPR